MICRVYGRKAEISNRVNESAGDEMTTASLQLASPAFISLLAGFCVRSSCSPPLSGSNYIHESGTNSFCSHKAVFIFHRPSIPYLKTSGEGAFPIRKGQSISISCDTNFDFKVLWDLLGFRYIEINTLRQPLPPTAKQFSSPLLVRLKEGVMILRWVARFPQYCLAL